MTTVFAFMPMFFVSGTLGKVIYIMPIVVCSMLLASLAESIIILPNHLSHVPAHDASARPAAAAG